MIHIVEVNDQSLLGKKGVYTSNWPSIAEKGLNVEIIMVRFGGCLQIGHTPKAWTTRVRIRVTDGPYVGHEIDDLHPDQIK